MWPFKKKKDVVDLSHLRDRRLAKTQVQADIGDNIDLTQQTSTTKESALGFLGNMASASNNSDTGSRGMRNKLEDIEYKLESISKRISQVIDRLDLIEKKVERFERRGI